MLISKLVLKNWKNFRYVDVDLKDRVFIVGPNASGKSNFLDVFRFLRDIAKPGGGLQEAVAIRGRQIKCLATKRTSCIEIEISLSNGLNRTAQWRYGIGFFQTGSDVVDTKAKLKYEKVWDETGRLILNRPNNKDKKDKRQLEQTYLEQLGSNAKFREIGDFLISIQYLHIIPHFLKDPNSYLKATNREDFYGRDFLDRVNNINKRIQHAFLKRIERALTFAIPQFKGLELIKDKNGKPHFKINYQHWRAKEANQWEDQFSDGTIRLIGLLWVLMDGNKSILLEEPELSLHEEIVSRLVDVITQLQKRKTGKRQVFLSTHSYQLLQNKGIGAEEVLMLIPRSTGTEIKYPSSTKEVSALLKTGMSIEDIVIPATAPEKVEQIGLI